MPNDATPPVVPPVPEPAASTLMISGFALTGLAARRRRATVAAWRATEPGRAEI